MRSRDIVGKTVESIAQQRAHDISGNPTMLLLSVRFTDGSVLILTGEDNGVDNYVTGRVYRKEELR